MIILGKIISNDSLTVIVDDNGVQEFRMDMTHPKFLEAVSALRSNELTKFVELYNFNPIADISNMKGITIEGEKILYNGMELHSTLVDRILELRRQNCDFDDMVKFLDNLMSNPSNRSVNELYNFLSHKNLPITDDGHFLGYKAVKIYNGSDFTDVFGNPVTAGDYVDKYSGTIRNNVGDVVKVVRNMVNDDCSQHCSHGLHVGSLEYSGPGGWYNRSSDVVLIVKVNPADVVSVPSDHSHTKLRCCKYEVISTFSGVLNKAVYSETDSLSYDDSIDEIRIECSINDLYPGDKISFVYTNSENETETRYLIVDEVTDTHIRSTLYNKDYRYNTTPSNYRNFKKSNIQGIIHREW